ncbi:hypothetical protein BHE90_017635 [Fusarium euwallaceae]|uniref:Hydrophobin n=1 Tax=Fusarium euwallaceae TaxID=1147111 RepID=A0A430KWY3_9HYPO|nr:hypothetical protein BHE90_017635 [Fusarium euwallaceae]
MKPATLLALPALALAAATPQVEERQFPGLPGLPGILDLLYLLDPTITLNTTCVLGITGILDCAPAINSNLTITPLSVLLGCTGEVAVDILECVL